MWGLSWNEMIWGGAGGGAAVPLSSPLGAFVLACALLGAGLLLSRRPRESSRVFWIGLVLVAVVPIAATAATLTLPHTFVNGTVADADEVNANFDAVVVESNAKDARIAALEATVSDLQAQINALEVSVAANANGVAANGAGIATNATDIATNASAIAVAVADVGQLQTDVASIQVDVGALQSDVAANQVSIASNANAVAALEATLAGVSRAGDLLTFSGMNVRVVDGSGTTAGATNGLGNLIVGYNENPFGETRTGSHNLVVGREHEYTSYGGLVAGRRNTISDVDASVCGGHLNTASGEASSVTGGQNNEASASYASVSGGNLNTASGTYSSVVGGWINSAAGDRSSVSGGTSRSAPGQYDWAAGSLFQDF